MNDEVTSECPAFKKGWSPEIQECKDCKEKFSDEYSACKKVCDTVASEPGNAPKEVPQKPVEKPKEAVQESPTSAPAETAEKPSAPSDKPKFKPFREGTRADVLIKYLIAEGACSFSEACKHLETVFDIDEAKAMGNVKDYCREWSRGKWNGKEVDLPFIVVIEDDAVACDAKE